MEVIIQPNAEKAAQAVADFIARALSAKPDLVLGLATGCTMESVYDRLVEKHRDEGLDFSRCHTFNLDEYVGLAADNPGSYHYYMRRRFFDAVNIDQRNTHLPDGMAKDLEAECANYERLIAANGGIDLQVLGIGLNGHLGFNEPLSAFRSRTRLQTLSRMTRAQNAPLFPSLNRVPHCAITMGVGTILEARHCLLLATGVEKAEIVAGAIEGPLTAMITATALQLHPSCTIVLDEDAASRLQKSEHYQRITAPSNGAAPRGLLAGKKNGHQPPAGPPPKPFLAGAS
jgi:glucosamine-6-phosphate deaminase